MCVCIGSQRLVGVPPPHNTTILWVVQVGKTRARHMARTMARQKGPKAPPFNCRRNSCGVNRATVPFSSCRVCVPTGDTPTRFVWLPQQSPEYCAGRTKTISKRCSTLSLSLSLTLKNNNRTGAQQQTGRQIQDLGDNCKTRKLIELCVSSATNFSSGNFQTLLVGSLTFAAGSNAPSPLNSSHRCEQTQMRSCGHTARCSGRIIVCYDSVCVRA